MSDWAQQRVVLAALRDCVGRDGAGAMIEPYRIAARTPDHVPRLYDGQKAQPWGERRVRKLLNELVAEGYVRRSRSFYVGMRYALESKGRDAL
jgi:hypothetical protein